MGMSKTKTPTNDAASVNTTTPAYMAADWMLGQVGVEEWQQRFPGVAYFALFTQPNHEGRVQQVETLTNLDMHNAHLLMVGELVNSGAMTVEMGEHVAASIKIAALVERENKG